MRYRDNIGNSVSAGDLIFCLTGAHAKSIQTAKKLGIKKDDIFGDNPTVTLACGGTVYALNVVSLTALGVQSDEICYDKIGLKGFDGLGHEIHIGDKILFLHKMECDCEIGTAIKMTQKQCQMRIAENRFHQTEYRQNYPEIISLNAIKREDLIVVKYWPGEEK